jgi:hypothetical protein
VCEPTLVVGEEAVDVCASCGVHIFGSHEMKYFDGYSFKAPPYRPESPDRTLEIVGPTSFSCLFDGDFFHTPSYGVFHDCSTLKVLETYWVLEPSRTLVKSGQVTLFTLNLRDLRRLQRLSRLVQQQQRPTFGPMITDMPPYWEARSIARIHNWNLKNSARLSLYSFDNDGHTVLSLSTILRYIWIAAGVTFAGVCYGGLHLVAWKTPFASSAEAFLWRTAGVSIMATGPFYVLAIVCDDSYTYTCSRIDQRFRNYGLTYTGPGIKRLLNVIIKRIFPGSLILWHIFCRSFIIVESFIMLAHIPEQSLQIPTWSAYIPHIV